MLIIVTYDVSTETKEGRKRLNKVAKKCVAHGQRVQNSVFECILDNSQYLILQSELKRIINQEEDSLRFYNLGTKYTDSVIHIGVKPSIPIDGNLIV
ncbi:MAG: CRISPR-associated endonuclease Cas2 [Clostridiales bacterium]|jgi:CRISPR-associated protein Cas2|nr:CRISPR-associated endonuclease Cas2 [Clostridiales bacterium]